MVAVQKPASRQPVGVATLLAAGTVLGLIGLFLMTQLHESSPSTSSQPKASITTPAPGPQCLSSIAHVPMEQRYPKAGLRYIVDPPADTKLTLVCCQTTKGPWSILVHHAWAPLGAQRFLDMVTSGYFDKAGVPLMRCVHNFLCQFGLAGDASNQFKARLQDDPQWLPKQGEQNGVLRFQRGFFSYAGSGANSRSMQIFVNFKDTSWLGGDSPWEVVWGELVGGDSYATLDALYTGYGEKGPSQPLLWQEGALDKVHEQFPLLDWVLSCKVVDELTVE